MIVGVFFVCCLPKVVLAGVEGVVGGVSDWFVVTEFVCVCVFDVGVKDAGSVSVFAMF